MNSVKSILMVGVLVVVAYGVYVSIHTNPVEPPPEGPEVSFPGDHAGGAPEFAIDGPTGFPSPGDPPVRRNDPLSPARPFSERAPAPPFSAAPMPPQITSDLAPPTPTGLSYGQAAQQVDPGDTTTDPGTPPLPDFNTANTPPLPPETSPYPAPGPVTPPAQTAIDSNPSSPMTEIGDRPQPEGSEIRPQFAQFLADARRDLDQGRFRETLAILSSRYGEPDQTAGEAAALTELLDQAAGTVIYSTEHHLEPAYVVQAGDTLSQIAEKHGVPMELLAKINGIPDPTKLQPGQQLKVLRGPFRAVVRLQDHEMDLWLQDLYAGRFPIGVGTELPDLAETFLVLEKNRAPSYYAPNGQVLEPGDPLNPFGSRRIGLGDTVAIHGTSDQGNIGQTGGPGSIRLGDQDIEDVFDILSLGSRVVIQR